MLIPRTLLLLYSRTDDINAFFLVQPCYSVARPAMVPWRSKDARLYATCVSADTGSWLVVCIFAALPMVPIHHISYTGCPLRETHVRYYHHRLDDWFWLITSPGLLIWRRCCNG
jgi:trk system potassium uptake protein TrkH